MNNRIYNKNQFPNLEDVDIDSLVKKVELKHKFKHMLF